MAWPEMTEEEKQNPPKPCPFCTKVCDRSCYVYDPNKTEPEFFELNGEIY